MDWWDVLSIILEKFQWKGPRHLTRDPFRTLVGCILSQRTKDEVTDQAFLRLFSKYKSVEELARADPEEIEKLIYPVGFYRIKARRIIEAARFILERFGGEVPKDRELLMQIPGIGRKCANIVLAYAFGEPAIPVDTHVARVTRRLGIVGEKANEQKVEEALMKIVPRERWIEVNHALVRFGKEICRPLRPKCDVCPIKRWCRYASGRPVLPPVL